MAIPDRQTTVLIIFWRSGMANITICDPGNISGLRPEDDSLGWRTGPTKPRDQNRLISAE